MWDDCSAPGGDPAPVNFGDAALRDWIVDEVADARQRLAHGVIDRIPSDRWRDFADGGGIAPVYVLWHLTRHHDVGVNAVLRGRDEVVHRWTERLGIDERLYRGLSEGADLDLVDRLDPEAVAGYALALLDDTIAWLRDDAPLHALDRVPDSHRALDALGTPSPDFDWLYEMWRGKTQRWFLSWEGIGHVITHTGELVSIRNRMGLSPF